MDYWHALVGVAIGALLSYIIADVNAMLTLAIAFSAVAGGVWGARNHKRFAPE